jgi:hypothetical protein
METLEAIRNAAKTIILEYPHGEDGRITSAVKEKEYLAKLKAALGKQFNFEIPKKRAWYDFKVDGIHINLKITDGGGDNAFNKSALVFTWGGVIPSKAPGNMNNMLSILKASPRLEQRDPLKEYHYLVVHKKTGTVLLKSIVDIHTYKVNCAAGNVMQINWNSEFKHAEHTSNNRGAKMVELVKVVQTACRKQVANMEEFAAYDIDSLM